MLLTKKLKRIEIVFPFVLVICVFVTLLGVEFTYAENAPLQEKICLNDIKHIIESYELNGNYHLALKIARDAHEEAVKFELNSDISYFSDSIKHLEQELLTLGFSRILFDENFQPREKLIQLLKIVGMEPLNKFEKSILQINTWAQNNLLRKGERWQDQTGKFESLKSEIKPLLRELGFLDNISSHFTKYQGAIVHGTTLTNVRIRLNYLVEQWKQGVRFLHLYFLSGERPLDPQQENENIFMNDKGSPLKICTCRLKLKKFPKTECEMMQLVWEHSQIPETMREEVMVYFINAPMKKDLKCDKLLRPTTDDTVEYWLKTKPPCGRYLAISNAPYINRQDVIIRALTHGSYSFDTIGPSANENLKIAIYLDEMARLIFQTKQLLEN